MKIAVLSASPKQQFSLTLQTVRTLQKMFPEDEFDISFIKKVDECSDFQEKANASDLIIILSSLYHFNVHGQLIAFLDGIKINPGKPITYISTSGGNMDVPAHNFVRSFAEHNGLKWIRSLSLLDEDVLKEFRREELYRWFLYVKDIVNETPLTETTLKDWRITILDCGDTPEATEETAKTLLGRYQKLGATVNLINLREKTIKGCIACFGCYTNNKCVIKDDFVEVADGIDANTDMLVVVSNVCYNQFSRHYKYFLDRHVKNGRFGQDLEMVRTYVYCGEVSGSDLAELEQHTLVVDSLDYNLHVGLYPGTEEGLNKAVTESSYACKNDLFPQRNTYTYGLSLQFANLAYRLQKMTIKDYEYFKSKGFYETPQIIEQVKPISGLEDGRMSCQMRLIAFEEMLSKLDGPPKLTKKGERSQFNYVIGYNPQKATSEKPKKGFGLFKKK